MIDVDTMSRMDVLGRFCRSGLPVIPVIGADVDGGLGSGEQQARLCGIDAQTVHPAPGALIMSEAIDNAGPGFATVGGAPDERHIRVLVGRDDPPALASDAAGT